jgi:GxGYxY sequence motif in domain of unknown function N-terminal/GxGYxYP putative glycoside hydrolase C-terminal domain
MKTKQRLHQFILTLIAVACVWTGAAYGQDPINWHSWDNPGSGSGFTNGFAACSWGPNRLDVFGVQQSSGKVYHNWWNGSAWQSSWENRGNTVAPVGAPGASANVNFPSREDIYYNGTDGNLYHQWWSNGTWSAWLSLGAPSGVKLLGSPSALSWGAGRFDVFVRGNDGNIWHIYDINYSSWSSWEGHGQNAAGAVTNDVAACTWGVNRLDLYTLGQGNGQIYHQYWAGSGWKPSISTWQQDLPETTANGLGASSWGISRIDLFANAGSDIAHSWYSEWTWPGWSETLTPPATPEMSPCAASWLPNRLDMFVVGSDGKCYHNWGSLANNVTWPAGHLLPTFATPAATIDCIDMDTCSNDEKACFDSLEGIVNRIQPSIGCVSAASEGEFTWMNAHNLAYETNDGYSCIQEYKTNALITSLVVYDTNQMDTLNLATTIAGVKGELVCDGILANKLTASPYNLVIQDDLRGMFSDKYGVYNYLYTNYWGLCTHRVMAGMETNNYWALRDYLVALNSAVVWLDPGSVSQDATLMAGFTSQMSPANSVYLGWWPSEGNDMQWIGGYGIPVMASDLFNNASVFSGVPVPITTQAIATPPTLGNKVYIALIMSDGDNAQLMQHRMRMIWSNWRGRVPIGWTAQPLLADFDPGMLNYYVTNASADDQLIAGPSGAGYAHIEYWSSANLAAYTKTNNSYLQRSGITGATVWDTMSATAKSDYAVNCTQLLGVTDQNDGWYTNDTGGLQIIGLPSGGSYEQTTNELISAINTTVSANYTGNNALFIAVQADSNVLGAEDMVNVAAQFPSYVFVRPDQLFTLMAEALGE